MSYWRSLCETAITGDFYSGIGRVGADYWPAIKNRRGRRVGWVNGRFIEVVGYLHSLHSYVLEPRADGQVAMTRLVALEEGALRARFGQLNMHAKTKSHTWVSVWACS